MDVALYLSQIMCVSVHVCVPLHEQATSVFFLAKIPMYIIESNVRSHSNFIILNVCFGGVCVHNLNHLVESFLTVVSVTLRNLLDNRHEMVFRESPYQSVKDWIGDRLDNLYSLKDIF